MSRKQKPPKKSRFKVRLLPFLVVILTGLVILLSYTIYLDFQVKIKFEGARWEVPSRVYARPLDIFAGARLTKSDFILELSKLRYKNRILTHAGSYYRRGSSVFVHTRAFEFPEESVPATRLKITFSGNSIKEVRNIDSREDVDLWRLEPVYIGGIYPRLNEDRVLIKLEQVPTALIQTLLAVEDRKFYEHHGVVPLSIMRAMIANIRAGGRVQGGSTLTQQLVKNFYLSNEKTFTRKINEAIMALLVELHYSKEEILQAYLNEVYLGQDGKRAIHGFGLAAQFYFDTNLANLDEAQIALLVGMVKGASFYDPRRNPERALKRRQLVQLTQQQQAIISQKKYVSQKNIGLGVSADKPSGTSPYPNFLDLVKRQLRRDYAPEDLQSEGLRLFTTLDPVLQHKTEKIVNKRLTTLEKNAKLPNNHLQVAVAISDPGTGLVRALIGGRDNRLSGFNRALDSKRNIGSLIKPVVYLTALQNDNKFHLSRIIQDSPISLPGGGGEDWVPENYDKKYHGETSLLNALVHSYNAATVRLGLNVGVDEVIHNLRNLGVEREIDNYPSLLLGAVEMSLFDIMQVYQSMAAQGFKTPLRAINTVARSSGEVLSRYPLTVEQSISPEHAYLILQAMQTVMTKGTGKSFYQKFPLSFNAAGKTGTTNDFRDSWFAGMTGDKLAVVWLGADDNTPIGLSGGRGALRVWTDIIAATQSQSMNLIAPEKIDFVNVNVLMQSNGEMTCIEDFQMPFVTGKLPSERERMSCTNE